MRPNVSSYKLVRYLSQLNLSNVRVRFAPSPTGELHLGGFRTAFLNYLFARSHNGRFILRIEDTDQSRIIPGAEKRLEDTLTWMDIAPDESPSLGGDYGPYRQSERCHLYREKVDELLQTGFAYRCFCTERRLELLKKDNVRRRLPPRYDGRCSHLSSEEIQEKLSQNLPFTVRLKLMPDIAEFHDLVFGRLSFDLAAVEGDPIILKSDGFPTYHLANVVDDHYMKITHVLRGVEWQVSTPKHLMLYKAFNWTPPQYAHVPLINNPDGTKLSKRQGNVHLEYFREKCFYKETIMNFASLIGGGFEEREHCVDKLLSKEEIISKFNLNSISRQSSQMDMDIFHLLNRTVIKDKLSTNQGQLLSDLRHFLKKSDFNPDEYKESYLKKVLDWSQNRIYSVEDLMQPEFRFLWSSPKQISLPEGLDVSVIRKIRSILQSQNNTGSDSNVVIKTFVKEVKEFCKQKELKFAQVMKLIRLSFTGYSEGPPIAEMIEVYGIPEALFKLDEAISLIEKNK